MDELTPKLAKDDIPKPSLVDSQWLDKLTLLWNKNGTRVLLPAG
jgi:hypothetical protein